MLQKTIVLPIRLHFLKAVSDRLIAAVIDFSLRSWWWMVIFVPSAVRRYHRSGCIKTVTTARGEICPSFSVFSQCVAASPYLPPTSFSVQRVRRSGSSWFGHWFQLGSACVWFKFSRGMHDPAAACRHCPASTGILPASCFTPPVSLRSDLVHFISLFSGFFFPLVCFLRYFCSCRQLGRRQDVGWLILRARVRFVVDLMFFLTCLCRLPPWWHIKPWAWASGRAYINQHGWTWNPFCVLFIF